MILALPRPVHACNFQAVAHSEKPAMPRLTSRDYLIHRQFLREQWEEHDGAAFTDLPMQEQRDLHDYYAPAVPFAEKEALAHRTAMTKVFPSLPQKAGRAYQAIQAAVDGTPNQTVDTYRDETTTVELIAGKRRPLRVTGVARPKIDHYRLARVLLALERQDTDGKLLARAKKIGRRRH
ncbi:hypothetical protein [Cryobacterium lyxosi]|uniref:Uncharacterized protein n=1 Tax=Cryobacterium lyxosi TaxID=1259228 RepID=A0A4R8ZCT7_9MICO|nr:hypothetical protein [Cryobacterium lyxosi]TFD23474.1 hypothetical protein E3T27_14895 [Cryobacterium lyxosi]